MAPNKSSFNTVIKAYANTGGKASARNAKRILNMMENPRLITASDGAANGGTDGGDNSTNESNNILENIEPDKISCNSILLAWANSRESDGGEKAEQLLERMEAVYRRGGNSGIKPDTVTYNAVIKVW